METLTVIESYIIDARTVVGLSMFSESEYYVNIERNVQRKGWVVVKRNVFADWNTARNAMIDLINDLEA